MFPGRKVALAAATLACASSANAAFFTYTFNLAGSGNRLTADYGKADAPVRYDALQAATIIFGVTSGSDESYAFGNDYYSDFSVGVGFSTYFDISAAPAQSVFIATGHGSTCAGCTASYSFRSKGGIAEDFAGTITAYSVVRAETGTQFLSIVGFVPEPATWALMLAGFGMVGYALRRRPRLSYAL